MRNADQLRLERDQLRDLLGRYARSRDADNVSDWLTFPECLHVWSLAAQARPIRREEDEGPRDS